ncbi:hypothetical protein [Haloarchaeobius sp. HME9146]|uniref:hypothetical protein n=1 Tax=Haloarchaeobius sp. HME9146 TaxID=2978732 RepID=UPI0021BF6098|nr:hypothetical protein [Haloarchaeobius sp. HME9146]MCT9098182.1 hypothetical protein [Haloarchaeobius sp. HME9146]
MDEQETEPVEISASLVAELSDRSRSAGFDSTREYIEYVLSATLAELDSIQEHRSEQDVESRLESLGYLK